MPQPTDRLDTIARLHDEARERALALRRQAIADLSGDLARALEAAADHAGRAARRWQQRLQRHRHQRAAAASIEA